MDPLSVPDHLPTPPPRAKVTPAELTRAGVVAVIAAVVGMACVVAPPFLIPGQIQRTYPAPLFPALWTAWENLAPIPTLLSLFVLGIVVGAIQPRFWRVLSWATVAPFPLAAVCEVIVSPTSHNLWPLEFAMYALLGIPSFAGAAIGKRIRGHL